MLSDGCSVGSNLLSLHQIYVIDSADKKRFEETGLVRFTERLRSELIAGLALYLLTSNP